MARDAELRQRLVAAGHDRSRLFDWSKHFSELFRVTKEAAL